MKTYLRNPIKYLLRHKVEKYRVELGKIRWRKLHLKPKARRSGMTESISLMLLNDIIMSMKYDRYIKRWSL